MAAGDGLGDGLGDGQSQPRASLPAAAGGIEAMEPLEDPLLRCRRDTWPAVLHAEKNLSAALLQTHHHPVTRRTVLHGVAEQIDQQPAQFRLHPQHAGVAGLNRRFQANRSGFSRFAEVLQHICVEFYEVAHPHEVPVRGALQAG